MNKLFLIFLPLVLACRAPDEVSFNTSAGQYDYLAANSGSIPLDNSTGNEFGVGIEVTWFLAARQMEITNLLDLVHDPIDIYQRNQVAAPVEVNVQQTQDQEAEAAAKAEQNELERAAEAAAKLAELSKGLPWDLRIAIAIGIIVLFVGAAFTLHRRHARKNGKKVTE